MKAGMMPDRLVVLSETEPDEWRFLTSRLTWTRLHDKAVRFDHEADAEPIAADFCGRVARLRTFWCGECGEVRWSLLSETGDGSARCLVCGNEIACDECGQEFNDEHRCAAADHETEGVQ